jgi:hypothetical protein
MRSEISVYVTGRKGKSGAHGIQLQKKERSSKLGSTHIER